MLEPELPPVEPDDDPELPPPELPMEPLEPPLEPPMEPPELDPVLPVDDPVLPVDEPEDDGLVTLPLLLLPLEPDFLIAASYSERLNRPSPFVSAALKSSPGTAAASLESI